MVGRRNNDVYIVKFYISINMMFIKISLFYRPTTDLTSQTLASQRLWIPLTDPITNLLVVLLSLLLL